MQSIREEDRLGCEQLGEGVRGSSWGEHGSKDE